MSRSAEAYEVRQLWRNSIEMIYKRNYVTASQMTFGRSLGRTAAVDRVTRSAGPVPGGRRWGTITTITR